MSTSGNKWLWPTLGGVVGLGIVAAFYILPPFPTLANWLLDVAGLVVTYLAGLVIISQFVLPVQTMEDRKRVLRHFLDYGFGARGPILFVKEGKLVARKEELKSVEQGVALLDSSSALVLERAHGAPGQPVVRAVGPGVAFIQPGERLVAALDLRKQSRNQKAKALTKDGIELEASVSVTFGLSLDPPKSGAPASADAEAAEHAERNRPARVFDPERAFRAVYGAAQGEKQPVEWTDLPLAVATECFRNVLSEYALDSLFQPAATHSNHYPYSEFQLRVTQAVKESYVLQQRGIVVFSAGVSVPKMPREVLNQRVRTWRARWQRASSQRLAAVDSEITRTLGHWRARAQAQILQDLQMVLAQNPEQSKPALALLLARTLQTVAHNPAARKQLAPEVLRMLDSLQESLK